MLEGNNKKFLRSCVGGVDLWFRGTFCGFLEIALVCGSASREWTSVLHMEEL